MWAAVQAMPPVAGGMVRTASAGRAGRGSGPAVTSPPSTTVPKVSQYSSPPANAASATPGSLSDEATALAMNGAEETGSR